MTKYLAFVLLFLLLIVSGAAAQDDYLPLFGNVQVERVIVATAVQGMGLNEREVYDVEAQYYTKLVQGYWGWFTDSSRVQPYTWDFDRWEPRDDVTPLVLAVATCEEYMHEGILYKHYNKLSCFDVGDTEIYDCWQFQGATSVEMAWHMNYVSVLQDDVNALIALLFRD